MNNLEQIWNNSIDRHRKEVLKKAEKDENLAMLLARGKFFKEKRELKQKKDKEHFDRYGYYPYEPPEIWPREHKPLFTLDEISVLVESFIAKLEKLLLDTPKKQWNGGTNARVFAIAAANQCGAGSTIKKIIGDAAEAGASPLEVAIIILKYSEKTFGSVWIASAVKTNLEIEGKLLRNPFLSALGKATCGWPIKKVINSLEAEGIPPALAREVVTSLEPFIKFHEEFKEMFNERKLQRN